MRMLYTLGVFIIVALAAPASTDAARIYLDPEKTTHNRLDTFYVPIRLDTQGECINAVQVALSYNSTELSIRDISIGNSILTLWTQLPTVERTQETRESGRITLEGGVPGGYCGRVEGDPGQSDVLATLVVTGVPQALEAGVATSTGIIVEPSTAAFISDGAGTEATLTVLGVDLVLVQATTTPQNIWLSDVKSDKTAPELFEVTLVEGPSVGQGKHYIAFSTIDKQSGVDHYEVLETDPDHFGFLTWVPREAHWITVESPYILRDQYLRSKIMVKAIDKNGNERTVEYTPPMSPLTVLTQPSTLIPLALILILVVTVVMFGVRLRSRKHHNKERVVTQPVSEEGTDKTAYDQ